MEYGGEKCWWDMEGVRDEGGGGFDQKHIICMYGILKQSTKKTLALVISTACVYY